MRWLLLLAITLMGCGDDDGGGPTKGPGGGGSDCRAGTEGEVWSKLAGTHMLQAKALGGGTEAYWTVGKSYAVVVDASSCSVVFNANSGQQVCQWTGKGWDYASETVKGKTFTINLQDDADQLQNTTNLCQLNYRIDLSQMGVSAFFLPKTNTGATFAPP